MPVPVNLVAWCKMGDDGSVLANRTYAGVATRIVPVTVLYKGDPAIVDGAGVRATGQVGGVQAPAPPSRATIQAPSRAP